MDEYQGMMSSSTKMELAMTPMMMTMTVALALALALADMDQHLSPLVAPSRKQADGGACAAHRSA
jgi:hypothetical protein